MTRVRIPQFTDLKTAIELYRNRVELSNSDITKLFGKHSSSTIVKLKKLAQEKMAEDNIMYFNAQCVNTAAAYKAWGLDINDLEQRYIRLQELGI